MAPNSSPEKKGVQDIDAPALEGMFTKELSTAFAALGCFNLAIFGATGRASPLWSTPSLVEMLPILGWGSR